MIDIGDHKTSFLETIQKFVFIFYHNYLQIVLNCSLLWFIVVACCDLQFLLSAVKYKTGALQETRTVQGEAREQVLTLCSPWVYYWPESSIQIDYFIVLPWTSVAKDLWLTLAGQSIAVTLTLAKELCGFDLLPNGEVLTCWGSGMTAELKWANIPLPFQCQFKEFRGGGQARDLWRSTLFLTCLCLACRPLLDPSVCTVSARRVKQEETFMVK